MLSNEKGLALPLAIMVTVVLVLLGTTLWFYSTTEILDVTRVERKMKAHYLSRSGMNLVVQLIKDHYSLLLNSDGFFVYGSLLDDQKELSFRYREYYDDSEYDKDSVDVVIEVEWDDTAGEGKIISIGYFLGATETIERLIFIKPDNEGIGGISEEDFLNKPPEETVGAVDAGPDGDLQWYDEDAKLQPGSGHPDSESPAYFRSGSYVYEFQASGNAPGAYFAAPMMFFEDTPDSIKIIHHNANLRLRTTLLVFKGNIVFDEPGSITLNDDRDATYEPLDSNNLYGSDINTMGLNDLEDRQPYLDKKYGVIYLGGDILDDDEEPIRPGMDGGFYLFHRNIDLGNSNDLGRLIKVDNIEDIDFDVLGILDLLIAEGIDFGLIGG